MHKRKIYPDVGDCRALIIDGNATSRSVLSSMLRDMGVMRVVQHARITDARRVLENSIFDIVLCDYHFDNTEISGQDLLDDLRRAQLLPHSTVFVMVTGEATYAKVAEVAEAALDSYLLKPHTANALEQRLLQARHRKFVLRSIYQAIDDGDFALAATECGTRFATKGEYWIYAARIGAELHIRLGQHDQARLLYQAVSEARALPWAKLGLARIEVETKKPQNACRLLETLISEQPTYADAFDVMARAQIDQGDLSAALETYRKAAEITPNSISRLQKLGALAFFCGSIDDAITSLERTVRIGVSSKMFDAQSLVLLAQMYFDKRDVKALTQIHCYIERFHERHPNSARLRAFFAVSSALKAVLEKKSVECVQHVIFLAEAITTDEFDFECATNLLGLLKRIEETEIRMPEAKQWIDTLSLRFCVSKVSTDLLCMAARGCDAYEAGLREGHMKINRMAESAMTLSFTLSPLSAVQALLVKGRETLNAKLIELAALMLNRHSAKIENFGLIGTEIDQIRKKYCSKGTRITLGSDAGRSIGGLTIRP